MFLKNLIIEKNSEIIREIKFRKGVNLIVDETPSQDEKTSGNNIGKTTVLRLIDFCLGGKGTNIYADPEFKLGGNIKVKRFLKEGNVFVTLVLKENLDDETSQEIIIKRNFISTGKDKICTINNEMFNEITFPQELKKRIFHSEIKKPSLRQVVSKNIRDEKNKLENTLQVLHGAARKNDYEALYLFWLGIDINTAEEKGQLVKEKKDLKTAKKKLMGNGSLSQVEQSLIIIKKSIDELMVKRKVLELNPDFELEVKQLDGITTEINQLHLERSRLITRRDLILESKNDLENDIAEINARQIKNLYESAKALMPKLQKTFEETLNFHNQMIENKVSYITQELPELGEKIEKISNNTKSLLEKEKVLTRKIHKNKALESMQKIMTKLAKASEDKGKLLERKVWWEGLGKDLKTVEQNLNRINESIDEKNKTIQERISQFNNYFSEISDQLYGEKFVLSSDRNGGEYTLNISTISGNPGTGKKRGEVAAFDLAYIQFAEEIGIRCLHFILHDQIEVVHDNQILTLLTEIVPKVNCQYITPVLKDKLPEGMELSHYEILSLSQEEKLFKLGD